MLRYCFNRSFDSFDFQKYQENYRMAKFSFTVKDKNELRKFYKITFFHSTFTSGIETAQAGIYKIMKIGVILSKTKI